MMKPWKRCKRKSCFECEIYQSGSGCIWELINKRLMEVARNLEFHAESVEELPFNRENEWGERVEVTDGEYHFYLHGEELGGVKLDDKAHDVYYWWVRKWENTILIPLLYEARKCLNCGTSHLWSICPKCNHKWSKVIEEEEEEEYI